MGDLIQSSPLLKSYRIAYPEAKLSLIVLEPFRAVGERLPMCDDVMGFDLDHFEPLLNSAGSDLTAAYKVLSNFIQRATERPVDLLVNLSHTPLSATIASLIGANSMIGLMRTPDGQLTVSSEWINYLFSVMQERSLNPFNLAEIYLRLGPGTTTTPSLSFHVSQVDQQEAQRLLSSVTVDINVPYVVLQPGASSDQRRWPESSFAELACLLKSNGVQVVVVGTKAESSLAERIVRMSAGAAVSLCGRTSIGSLSAILLSATRLVSNDTGTMHLAAAVGTPTISLFLGPASAKDTAPLGNGHIVIETDLECAPCSYNMTCANPICREQVSAEDILPFCLYTGDDVFNSARCMKGVRVYQTSNDIERLRLNSLNKPHTGYSSSVLSFYRCFWDMLLTGAAVVEGTAEWYEGEDNSSWMEGISELERIFDRAERLLAELYTESASINRQTDTLKDCLKQQIVWQEMLRAFMQKYPQLAAFPRFLLVKAVTARSHRLEDYLVDMTETVDLFHHGVSLLKTLSANLQNEDQLYACCE
jgi:ADP-heptose:LPS heptosyltransferase